MSNMSDILAYPMIVARFATVACGLFLLSRLVMVRPPAPFGAGGLAVN